MRVNSGRCYNHRSMQRILIGVILIVGLSSLLTAQRAGQQQTPPSVRPGAPAVQREDDTISVYVDLVNLLFTVADRKGKFVTNLRKEDFKVYEDDKLQSITNFSSESNLPLTISLL